MAKESRPEKWNPFGVLGIPFLFYRSRRPGRYLIWLPKQRRIRIAQCYILTGRDKHLAQHRRAEGSCAGANESRSQESGRTKNPNRGTLSFVAMICDNPSIQPRLPQIIVGNEHILRVQDMQDIAAALPENVFLVRRKSCRVDHVFFCSILELLRAAVSKIEPRMQIVMLLDASPVHTHDLVLRTAKRVRIRICLLPASSTWLLQPCDTNLFRKLKAGLAR